MKISLLVGLAHAATGPSASGADEVEPVKDEERAGSAPMTILKTLVGRWEGTCRTWFRPGELADESSIAGEFRPLLDGTFLRHTYAGSIQGKSRAGEELLAYNKVKNVFQISWVDDFHMSYAIMFSEGEATETGFSVFGHYDVGPGESPWGWRTTYELKGSDQLVITAYNVTPDGQEAKAVETVYRRVASQGKD